MPLSRIYLLDSHHNHSHSRSDHRQNSHRYSIWLEALGLPNLVLISRVTLGQASEFFSWSVSV